VRDNFYKLDGVSQSIYRFFGLFNVKRLDIEIEKIFELLEYNRSNNKTNIKRRVLEMFEKMKDLNLIKNYNFKYDIIEIEN
jgi:hypothetical protein